MVQVGKENGLDEDVATELERRTQVQAEFGRQATKTCCNSCN